MARPVKPTPCLSPTLQAQYDTTPWIAGSDESGMGSWAGPLVVAVVRAPHGWSGPEGLKDSKRFTSKDRMRWVYDAIRKDPTISFQIGTAQAHDVDRVRVDHANRQLHKILHDRIQGDTPQGQVLHIVDGNMAMPFGIHSVVDADAFVPTVQAAAILAKITHDDQMLQLARQYPEYEFDKNFGYHSDAHVAALAAYGVSACHRMSYRPVRETFAKNAVIRQPLPLDGQAP